LKNLSYKAWVNKMKTKPAPKGLENEMQGTKAAAKAEKRKEK